MSQGASMRSAVGSQDKSLALLVERLTARLQRGEVVDLSEEVRQHPERVGGNRTGSSRLVRQTRPPACQRDLSAVRSQQHTSRGRRRRTAAIDPSGTSRRNTPCT